MIDYRIFHHQSRQFPARQGVGDFHHADFQQTGRVKRVIIMKDQNDASIHISIRKISIELALTLIIFFTVLGVVCSFTGVDNSYQHIALSEDPHITCQITRTNGRVETYHQMTFPAMYKGDRLTVTIPPMGKYGFDGAALIFDIYHCRVSVFSGSEVVYRQEDPAEGRLIGRRIYTVSLPDNYQDRPITIHAVMDEGGSVSIIHNLRIVRDTQSVYALQVGKTPVVFLLLSLLIGDLFLICLSITVSVRNRHISSLFFITLFCASMICWFMGYENLYMAFLNNSDFAANIEYAGICLAAAPLQAYMALEISGKHFRIISAAMSIFSFIIFGAATGLNYADNHITYVDFMPLVRTFLIFCFIINIAGVILDIRSRRTDRHILHIGFILAMSIGLAELLRFYLASRWVAQYAFLYNSLTPIALIVLMVSILLYYGTRLASNSLIRIERTSLERLAYIDQLTGAPNRSSCYREIDLMKSRKIKDFVFVFIDINFLKLTNDTWGHEKGDELIRTASSLLKKYFSDDGFYGRWGGDEFIACHFGSADETRAIMDQISEDINAVNASGKFDFSMSESWGFGVSTSAEPLTPEEAINRADEEMYTVKAMVHARREDAEAMTAQNGKSRPSNPARPGLGTING